MLFPPLGYCGFKAGFQCNQNEKFSEGPNTWDRHVTMSGAAGTGCGNRGIFSMATGKTLSPPQELTDSSQSGGPGHPKTRHRDDPNPAPDSHNHGAGRGGGVQEPKTSQELRSTSQNASKVPRRRQDLKKPGPSSQSSGVLELGRMR